MKKRIKHFFLETPVGRKILKSIGVLNTIEGIIHLVVAVISGLSLIRLGVYDLGAWTATIENLILGGFSLFTGYVLGLGHHHHHHE
jgi:hypothetical protein